MTIYAGYGRFEPMSVELDKIVELQAENAKLRAALEQIAAMKGGQGFLLSCPDIARRALEDK